MIDFTNSIEQFNTYKGSEKKKTLIYNGKKYLVKFPDPVREKNKNISYINNSFSEYVGSSIFKICGFNVQNTIIGTYKYNGKDKIVCACEDFTDSESHLIEFENLALSFDLDKKIETELSDIFSVIKLNDWLINAKETIEKFWDMFIIDCLIGNNDRHNGNWGFILWENKQTIKFSPIYDCGSCLNPMIDDDEIKKLSDTDIKNLALNSFSCLKENNKKINPIAYLKSRNNKDALDALKRVFNKINMDEIIKFIDNIVCISKERKNFYKNILTIRFNELKKIYEQE